MNHGRRPFEEKNCPLGSGQDGEHRAPGAGEAAADHAELILICFNPQTVRQVCEEILPAVDSSKLVVSVAASVPTRSIEKFLASEIPAVRAMPNTPCSVEAGMTALCGGRFAQPHHLE